MQELIKVNCLCGTALKVNSVSSAVEGSVRVFTAGVDPCPACAAGMELEDVVTEMARLGLDPGETEHDAAEDQAPELSSELQGSTVERGESVLGPGESEGETGSSGSAQGTGHMAEGA